MSETPSDSDEHIQVYFDSWNDHKQYPEALKEKCVTASTSPGCCLFCNYLPQPLDEVDERGVALSLKRKEKIFMRAAPYSDSSVQPATVTNAASTGFRSGVSVAVKVLIGPYRNAYTSFLPSPHSSMPSSNWGTDVPPDASTGVFTITGSIKIKAPVEQVWSTLLDFKSYKEWCVNEKPRGLVFIFSSRNPFVRDQKLVDNTGTPLPDPYQTPTVGSRMYLSPIHLPPTMSYQSSPLRKISVPVAVTYLSHEDHRVAWRSSNFPRILFDAERWQTLSVEEDGKVKYESFEVMRGLLAYFVKWFVGSNLRIGTRAMAEGLKEQAEGR